jgi:carboxymethylenebutenolidase
MGQKITLTASDKFELGAYRADPAGTPKGGIVVIQEIYGVNHRTEPGFERGYSPEEMAEARKFLANPDLDAALRDVQAAIDALRPLGPVGVVGFCFGGSLAFLAATRLTGLDAAVAYYGGLIAKFADEKPKVPTLMHFGGEDASIPLSDVELIKAKRTDCELHVYEKAKHAFHNDERPNYHKASADLAWQRTLAFLAKHLKR